MEVGGGFICEVPNCVTEGGSSPGPLGAGLFSMPRFGTDTQKSSPRPHQRGKTSQPLHGANYFFADLSKFFLTFALSIAHPFVPSPTKETFSFYSSRKPSSPRLFFIFFTICTDCKFLSSNQNAGPSTSSAQISAKCADTSISIPLFQQLEEHLCTRKAGSRATVPPCRTQTAVLH